MKCYVHPDVDAVGTCTVCGKSICQNCAVDMNGKLTCKSCVEKMASQPSGKATVKKEPALALLLSLVSGLVSGLMIGLGQIYNGQVRKDITLCAANIVIRATVILYVMLAITPSTIYYLPIFVILFLSRLYPI